MNNGFYKESKVTFNKSGSGSISGRVTIPVEMLKLLSISEENREIRISYIDGTIVIEKLNEDK